MQTSDTTSFVTVNNIRSDRPNKYLFSYTSAIAFDVQFHMQYFPLWKLTEVGGDTVCLKANSLGFLGAELPVGKHSYTLILPKTQEEKIGATISWFAIAVTAIVGIFAFRKKRKS
jgi:hypothetical protein